jgi:predicted nucleic acid-binding protein
MSKVFVDTNILMYAHDTAAGDKHKIARHVIEGVWASGGGVVSSQVLEELSVNLRREALHPLSAEATRQLIRDYMSWEVVVVDAEGVLEALELEERYEVPFWDALILHAANKAGVEFVLSEDIAADQRYGSFKVVNPFASSKG